MDGRERVKNMQAAGFSSAEISQWEEEERKTLSSAGFSQQEVDEYFSGVKPFDPKPLQEYVGKNIAEAKAATQGEGVEKPFEWQDALDAGFGTSVTGLAYRAKLPEPLPQDASTLESIAYGVGMAGGDLPFTIMGFLAGTPGGPLAMGGAAYALPAGLRAAYIDNLQNGAVKGPKEFTQRASGVLMETAKGYTTGMTATAVSAKVAGALPAATTALGSTARSIAVGVTEATTATATAAALEMQLPTVKDFTVGALMVAATAGTAYTAKKLGTVYKQTGLTPQEVAFDASVDPTVKADLLSKNIEVPRAYQNGVDPMFAPKDVVADTPEVSVPEPVGLSQSAKNVLNNVVDGKQKTSVSLSWRKGYAKVVDSFDPIKQYVNQLKTATGKEIPEYQDPYVLARLSKGAPGKAQYFLNQGQFEYASLMDIPEGKSLKNILSPIVDSKELDSFTAYLVSKRAQELEARGIQSGFKKEDVDTTVLEYDGKFSQTAKDLYTFQNNLTAYLRDSGIISAKAYDKMLEANKDFVPFYRLVEEERVAGTGGKGLQARQPIKKITGSELAVLDPIESIIKNVYTYISLAEKNRSAAAFVALADDYRKSVKTEYLDPSLLIEKKKTPIRPIDIKDTEMEAFLKQQGVPDDVIDDVFLEGLTVFRAMREPLAADEIAVFEAGKRVVYKVDPGLAEAFQNGDTQTLSLLYKITTLPARIKRAGITITPEFTLRNFIIDQFDAFTNTKTGYIPYADMLSGLISLAKKDTAYKETLKAGGFQASLVSLDRNYLKNDLFNISNEHGLVKNAWNVIKSPIEFFAMLSQASDEITRLGESKRALKQKANAPYAEKLAYAGFAAREVLPDFARSGSSKSLKWWAAHTAFFSAQIQGTDRLARAWKDNPSRTAFRAVTTVTLPSIVLWYVNKDDDRYQEAPQWQKDLYWIVPTDDWQKASEEEIDQRDNGKLPKYLFKETNGVVEFNKGAVIKIPKPREMGLLFGSSIERVLDGVFKNDPEGFKSFGKVLQEAFVPGYVPDILTPMLENASNISLFTGGPIVPYDVQDALPEVQYTPYTTETSKAVGGFLSQFPFLSGQKPGAHTIAPAVLENYIRQWTGGTGVALLQIGDWSLRKAGVVPDPVLPESTLADIPIVRALITRYPSAQTASIQSFYDGYNRRQKIINTYEFYAKKEQNAEKVKAFLKQYPKNVLNNAVGAKQALTAIQTSIRQVYKNPKIDAVEKRQLIDQMYYSMIEVAKRGNQQLRELDKWAAENPAPSD